jgi:glycosyltransferase involved in cell wall biosynthesis
MCKISIILPVYNVEKYLLRCLESISNQTFKDFEIIAINDGATDSSLRILEEYTNKEKRLKIFSQENQGLSAARNIGMKNAKGEYIYFLDSDDAIHPQLLEIVYDFATKHSADLVCFDYQKSDGISLNTSSISIDKIKPKITFTPLFEGRKLIKFNVWNKLYKRDLIKDITYIDNINFEDYPFTYAVLAKHPKTVFINSVLYFYTINMSSITKQKANPKMI